MRAKVRKKYRKSTSRPKKILTGLLSRPKKAPPASPLDNITNNSARLHTRDFYKMRDTAAKILDHSRTHICGKRLISGSWVPVIKNIYDKKHYSNLMKCGSVWVCPVCNYRIGSVRRKEIENIVDQVKNEIINTETGEIIEAKKIYHLTLTIRHSQFDDLEKQLKEMSGKFADIAKKKQYKELFRNTKYIRALEITHGSNGWHPHYHILLITNYLDHEKLRKFTHEWNELTRSTEENTKLRQCNSREDIEEYISKFEIKQELTNSVNKTSQNYWGFLCDPEGNEKLIKEYYRATKGMRSITFSRGLKIKTDEEIMESTDKAIRNLLEIYKPVYFDIIVKNQLYKSVIDNAESLEKIDNIFKDYKVKRNENRLIPENSENYKAVSDFEIIKDNTFVFGGIKRKKFDPGEIKRFSDELIEDQFWQTG